MTLREWLAQAESQLSAGPHPDRARQDAETLLLHLIGKNKAWLMAHADDDFAGCTAIRYAALLERRRKGEPIQYITGETEFYGLPFLVTPDVLIPRPETEHLVEKAVALSKTLGAPGPGSPRTGLSSRGGDPSPLGTWETSNPDEPGAPGLDSETGETASNDTSLGAPFTTRPLRHEWESNDHASPVRILDVGTGSGAVPVALATQLRKAVITATDISEPALSVAHENANRNGVAIRFLQGDLLSPVAGESFDLIVSNPPYVPAVDRNSLAVEVRDHEPSLALFSGDDGLEVYRRLIPQAFAALAPGGFLALEIGYGQQSAIHSLLADAGFTNIEFTPDLQGIPRVAVAKRPSISSINTESVSLRILPAKPIHPRA